MKTKILYILSAAVLFAGCFESVSYETSYALKPLVQEEEGDVARALLDVEAFAYAVDTTRWTVASYDDALNGIITSKIDPADKKTDPPIVAEPYQDLGPEWWLRMPVDNPSLMIVAVDTRDKIYAYTQQAFVENMSGGLYVSLVFKLWKKGTVYKDGNWSFYNEFYVPPPEVKTYIDFKVQPTEGGAEVVPAKNTANVYAFAADTTEWYIASYADANAGVITSKVDPKNKRTNPSFKSSRDDVTGQYSIAATKETLMIVVVDRADQIYAYSKQTVAIPGAPKTFGITIRPWKDTYLYVEDEGGWRVVDEALKPAPEEPAEP